MMGACLTLHKHTLQLEEARRRSGEIDKQLDMAAVERTKIIKILLLGAGESGKSTLVKQMKIIHSHGFTFAERSSYRPTMLDNLLASMKYVLTGMSRLRINLQDPANKIHAQEVLLSKSVFDQQFRVIPAVAVALKTLWRDRGIRFAVARGYEYELNDSALYLFESMDRLLEDNYIPTPTDVLRARVRTTGILETHFKIDDIIISVYDVGGQRSQRKKWIYCFDDVKAVLFVVSLSAYDMTLSEDPSVNRMEESLNLFTQIINNRYFRQASFVLFFNKLDLFRDKILHSGRHLRKYFPHYKGPNRDVDNAALFIQAEFSSRNQNKNKLIFPHFTTATDTSNIQGVFQVVMDMVLADNVGQVTLL